MPWEHSTCLPQACLKTHPLLPSDPGALEGRTEVQHKLQPQALRGEISTVVCMTAVSSLPSICGVTCHWGQRKAMMGCMAGGLPTLVPSALSL